MDQPDRILVVDDGELRDVRELLEELGVECSHVQGADALAGARPPTQLLIANTRHAVAVAEACSGFEGSGGPAAVVVAKEDSPALRTRLRQAGYDFLVRVPVDRGALRLLLLRLLYHGPERRQEPRLPSGHEVSYRMGLKLEHAVLIDLSGSGCRLLATRPVPLGTLIEVQIPSAAPGELLTLRARVLRCGHGELEGSDDAGFSLGLRFEDMPSSTRSMLRALVSRGLAGESDSERRRGDRKRFHRPVSGGCDEADRVLMGRDVSLGGMRVEPHPDLTVGMKLRVALHLEGAGSAPLEVDAVVTRDDGSHGMALRFDNLDGHAAGRLEDAVAALPPLEYLPPGERDALGAVLSEIVSLART